MVQYSCDFNRGGLVRLMGGITYTAHTRGRLTVAGLVLYEILMGQVVSHFVLAVSLRLGVPKTHDSATTWMGFMFHSHGYGLSSYTISTRSGKGHTNGYA